MSAPQITIQFSPRAQQLMANLSDLRGVQNGIRRGVDLALQETVGVIQRQFLNYPSGGPTTPEGLRHISGRLFKSVRATKAVISGDTVTATIGSNVKYAAVHEFGFTGTVMVGGHVRKRSANRWFLGAEPSREEFERPKRIKGEKLPDYNERVAQAQSDFYTQQNLKATGRPQRRLVQKRVRVGDVMVRPHQRKMNLPERMPFRRGILQNVDSIKAIVSGEVIRELTK